MFTVPSPRVVNRKTGGVSLCGRRAGGHTLAGAADRKPTTGPELTRLLPRIARPDVQLARVGRLELGGGAFPKEHVVRRFVRRRSCVQTHKRGHTCVGGLPEGRLRDKRDARAAAPPRIVITGYPSIPRSGLLGSLSTGSAAAASPSSKCVSASDARWPPAEKPITAMRLRA